jgi:hypothetical protein
MPDTLYCPACGETASLFLALHVSPGGTFEFECSCGTVWSIEFSYTEEDETCLT